MKLALTDPSQTYTVYLKAYTGQQIFKIGLLPGKVLVNMIDPFNVCTNIISDSLDHVGI